MGNETSFRGWVYRDLLRPIAEVDALGNVVARYVYSDGDGARQNGVGQLMARLGKANNAQMVPSGRSVPESIELFDANGQLTEVYDLVTDGIGSVVLVVDQAGAIVQRNEYTSGGRLVSNRTQGLVPFGFAGGIQDEATGFVRFGARDYDTRIGRWISRDPVRFRGGNNGYAYADNDPVNLADPFGFSPTPWRDAACLAGGLTCGVACLSYAATLGLSNCSSCAACVGGVLTIDDDCDRGNPCGSNGRGQGSCRPDDEEPKTPEPDDCDPSSACCY